MLRLGPVLPLIQLALLTEASSTVNTPARAARLLVAVAPEPIRPQRTGPGSVISGVGAFLVALATVFEFVWFLLKRSTKV